MMLQNTAKQFIRSILTVKHTSPKYSWNCNVRLFCTNQNTNDYGGLSANDTKVIQYLTKAKTEYYDLVSRKESLGRDGHEKIKELKQIVEVFERRDAMVENLAILNEELAKEKDTELLSMMKDEKEVNHCQEHTKIYQKFKFLRSGITLVLDSIILITKIFASGYLF